jgi:hypothetical protein
MKWREPVDFNLRIRLTGLQQFILSDSYFGVPPAPQSWGIARGGKDQSCRSFAPQFQQTVNVVV